MFKGAELDTLKTASDKKRFKALQPFLQQFHQTKETSSQAPALSEQSHDNFLDVYDEQESNHQPHVEMTIDLGIYDVQNFSEAENLTVNNIPCVELRDPTSLPHTRGGICDIEPAPGIFKPILEVIDRPAEQDIFVGANHQNRKRRHYDD